MLSVLTTRQWFGRNNSKEFRVSSLKVSICCMKGKFTLPNMIEPPTLMRSLFSGVDPMSVNFISNLRSYNNMFAFTSFGGKIENVGNDGRGPPNFVISGQNYHRIGSLVPSVGERPKFAQLYIYDTKNEVQNRLSHFRDESSHNQLDPSLVEDLLNVMDEHNILVQSFRMVRDFYRLNQEVPVKLRLFRNRSFDPRTYNVPHLSEVATLIAGDFDSSEDGRDKVVRGRDGHFQRIHETHARVRVMLGEFIAFRLQERLVEDSVLFNSKRLFQQFVVDLYSMIESQRLSYIRNNQLNIRADFLACVEEAVTRGDVDYASSIGSRVVLPSSFTGGRKYMFNNCQDAMALNKKFGNPDLFLTMTCNPKW
ncbi:hypothetical protein TSUD_220030 [Trifolium subterraneum]|uniref:Helitron helicase-like domain-containing protein n=1 Tax=Trifolium subterraneum TaxID=3900 RepID=A0A2Z6NSH1_TRISU|nr:hypothetical protein TSUD_220030 [Trifolium subterraneum]